MKVVTSSEMREIERAAIEDVGMPLLILMERAGLAVAAIVRDQFKPQKVIVLCGSGNNGGDGLVVARNLHNWGWAVKAFILAEENSLSKDSSFQLALCRNIGVSIEFRRTLTASDTHGAVVIDAVFGTGLSRPVTGDIAEIFSIINTSNRPVIAVDIPSGISADTGEIFGMAVRATCTVTFGLPKRGHFLYPGAMYSGALRIEDIGFPPGLLASEKIKVELIDRQLASSFMPDRVRYSHKGNYGHVFIIAGSRGKTGAAVMAGQSCMRAGAGLVTLGVPASLIGVFENRVTEVMTLPLPDNGKGVLTAQALSEILGFITRGVSVVAIGPGLGVSDDTHTVIAGLIKKSNLPLVIDADGINALQENISILKSAGCPVILTPHPGEMARLTKSDIQVPQRPFDSASSGSSAKATIAEIEKDRIGAALSFADKTGACLVLKGVPTVVTTPTLNAFINTVGNPGMATAGSGDVLTGIIAGLISQGLKPDNAALLGVYLHGWAGDSASRDKGEHALIASDIIDHLPHAFRMLAENASA